MRIVSFSLVMVVALIGSAIRLPRPTTLSPSDQDREGQAARHLRAAYMLKDRTAFAQFTSTAFTAVLLREKIAISMDGKGCWRDNVLVERLWRSVKYEEVYLKAYTSIPEARTGIGSYIGFYNAVRPHPRLAAARAALLPLPAVAWQPCEKHTERHLGLVPVATVPHTPRVGISTR